MAFDVLTPPALQKPAAVTEPEPEIDRLLGLRRTSPSSAWFACSAACP
jgi:hypothetical protein